MELLLEQCATLLYYLFELLVGILVSLCHVLSEFLSILGAKLVKKTKSAYLIFIFLYLCSHIQSFSR